LDLPRLPLDQVELAVAAHRATIAISPAEAAQVRAVIEASETDFDQTVTQIRAQLQAQLKKISLAEQQCVDLLGDPNWPVEKLSVRVEQLGLERAGVEAKLAEADDQPDVRDSNRQIEALVQLLEAPRRIYETIAEESRKVLNQACFTRLYLDSRDDRMPFIDRQEYSEAMKPLLEQINEIRNEQGLNNRAKGGNNRASGCTKRGMVEVLHAYAKPNPQVDAILESLENAQEADESSSGLSWQSRSGSELPVIVTPSMPPRILHRRLTAEQRQAIVTAFSHGTPQKELAARHDISVRSVRRLVRDARESTAITDHLRTP
jgi:DNA-binding NarL/FixJ family response regulator